MECVQANKIFVTYYFLQRKPTHIHDLSIAKEKMCIKMCYKFEPHSNKNIIKWAFDRAVICLSDHCTYVCLVNQYANLT